jgi:hypothetical protein
MKWPLRYAAPNGMIIPAIPCLRTCLREALWRSKAGMPDYGMQARDLKKNKY